MGQLRIAFRVISPMIVLQTSLTAQAVPPADPAFKAQFEEGQQALKAGRYKDAITALKKANKLQHNSCGECYLLLAVACYRSGELAQCEENCDKAAATATDDGMRAGFHLNLARALLRQSKDDEAKQELQSCLGLHPDEKQASEARLLLSDPRRGCEEFAPRFEVSTLPRQQISLKQLAGRVVVMDFWATWCPPCCDSVPELKELTKKYPTEKLMLISVSADKDDRAWREFVAKKNMEWAQYRDADHSILDRFGIHSFPTYLVIDGDGIIKERLTGVNPRQSVVARLRSTLGQMPLEGEAHK
jgi:thioredoxin-like negative regulator of GroEL